MGAGVGVDHSGQAGGEISGSTQIVAAPDLGGLTSAVSGIGSQLSLLNGAPEEEQAACLRRQREIAAAYERMEEFPNGKS